MNHPGCLERSATSVEDRFRRDIVGQNRVTPRGAVARGERFTRLPAPMGRLTRVRAASLLGLSFDILVSEASKHDLDAIDYDLDDFRRELAGGP